MVTRGKLEVYQKAEKPLPSGWAADEKGISCQEAKKVIQNICEKKGGGIYPLGGDTETLGSLDVLPPPVEDGGFLLHRSLLLLEVLHGLHRRFRSGPSGPTFQILATELSHPFV